MQTVDQALLTYIKNKNEKEILIVENLNYCFTMNPIFNMKPDLAGKLFFYSLCGEEKHIPEEILDEYPRLETSWNLVQEVIPNILAKKQLEYGFYLDGDILHQKINFNGLKMSIIPYSIYTLMCAQKMLCDGLKLTYGHFGFSLVEPEMDINPKFASFSIPEIVTTKCKTFFEPPVIDLIKNKVGEYYKVLDTNVSNRCITKWDDYTSVLGLNVLLASLGSNSFKEYRGEIHKELLPLVERIQNEHAPL